MPPVGAPVAPAVVPVEPVVAPGDVVVLDAALDAPNPLERLLFPQPSAAIAKARLVVAPTLK